MDDRLDKVRNEVREAINQISRGNNGGGYHLCTAISYLIDEIDDMSKEISVLKTNSKSI